MIRRLLIVLWAAVALALAASPAIEDARKKSKAGKHEEAIAALDAELKKNPKDADAKAALADVHTAFGESVMFNEQLPPFRKYPQALTQFRKAVEYNPKQKKAIEHIATIEGIYKSMGRPIPK